MNFRKKKEKNKNMGISIEQNTNNTCEHGDKYVQVWKRREMRLHVQIHIRRNQNNKHAGRQGGQTYEQGHAYNKNTVPQICIEFRKKENINR